MELEIVELFLQPPNLMSICRHARVAIVWLSHDLVDDELRVTTNVKPLNPKLDGNAQAIDECLVLWHIVSCMKVQSNYVEEPISLSGDQYDASPDPLRVKEQSKYMLQCCWVTGGCSCWVSVHSATKLSYPILWTKSSTHCMCAQGHLFHTHGHKVFIDSQMSQIKYHYYINNVSKD
jgi:hypothetical protein